MRPYSATFMAQANASIALKPLDLATQVSNRKRDLIEEIIEYKKGSRLDAKDVIERLQGQLTDLAQIVKLGANDESSKVRLVAWMAR
jgi:hypothetical protein